MLKATIKQWQAGIDAYKAGNFNEAQNCFKSIDDTSKILYCLGIVYFKQNNYVEAAATFGKSVKCDPFLSVSYFMRGASCHQKNDLSTAIVHYDEAIQALRGHEYIDYKQLGMDYKLLLCEILFNKALCMQKNGGQAAVSQLLQSATSCKMVRDEKNRFRFEDQCNAVGSGGAGSAQPFNVPLDLMFQPPKIKAEKPKLTGDSSPAPAARPTAALPSRPSPSTSSSLSSLSSSSYSSSASVSNIPPAVPKKPGSQIGKKLPPRPISLKVEATLITVKCFYKDRRLIQINSSDPDYSELKEKIKAKFLVDGLEIRYQNTNGNMQVIRTNQDLRTAIRADLHELYLGLDGEVNDFEPTPGYGSGQVTSPTLSGPPIPPKSSGYKAAQASLGQPATPTRKLSTSSPSVIPNTKSAPQAIPKPVQQQAAIQKASSQPINASVLLKQSVATPVSTSQPKTSFIKQNQTPAVPSRPAKNNVWQECYTDDGERYFFNTETQETSWDPDIDPSPPWIICYTDAGDKYYYNTTNDSSSWEFPG